MPAAQRGLGLDKHFEAGLEVIANQHILGKETVDALPSYIPNNEPDSEDQ